MIASIFSFLGPDLIITLMIFWGVPVVAALLLFRHFSRRRPGTPHLNSRSAADRLQELERLRQNRLISDQEYEAQRKQIISGV